MQFRRQSNSEDSINLTPLIDVVFLLLIFFMVSTTFTKETHLKLDLPEADGDPLPDIADKIEIIINADGGYSVNGKPLINKQANTLQTAVQSVGQGNTELPFLITADKNVPYQWVILAMDVANTLGYSNLKITTQRPGGGQ